jgi:signal transduction histidine kinase
MVNADEYTITQIFDNLLGNAVKYTLEGEIEINVKRNKRSIRIEISDTGIGISKEYLPNLFQPFTQEEQGYTRKFEGTGLGLALVKKYCDLNNAEIECESEKGKGTMFRITFPVST